MASNNQNSTNQEPYIIIERHYIPERLYRDLYRDGLNINLQQQNNNVRVPVSTASAMRNNIPTSYNVYNPTVSTSTNNNNQQQTFETLNRRSTRMNRNVNEILSNILYGPNNTTNNTTNNINTVRDTPTTNSSETFVPTSPVNEVPDQTDANLPYNNMHFLVRDSDGNSFSYNMNLSNNNDLTTLTPTTQQTVNSNVAGNTTTTTMPTNTVSSFFTRLMDPSISLNEVFNNQQNNNYQQNTRGLTLTEINQNTEIYTYSNNDEDAEEEQCCSICREEYDEEDIIRKLNMCNHEFHRICIDEWLTANRNCPMCRTSIVPDNN